MLLLTLPLILPLSSLHPYLHYWGPSHHHGCSLLSSLSNRLPLTWFLLSPNKANETTEQKLPERDRYGYLIMRLIHGLAWEGYFVIEMKQQWLLHSWAWTERDCNGWSTDGGGKRRQRERRWTCVGGGDGNLWVGEGNVSKGEMTSCRPCWVRLEGIVRHSCKVMRKTLNSLCKRIKRKKNNSLLLYTFLNITR